MKSAGPFSLDRTFWPAVGILGVVWVFFQGTALDLNGRAFVHTGLGAVRAGRVLAAGLLGVLALAALVLALGPTRRRKRVSSPPLRRRDLLVVAATLVSVPILMESGARVLPLFAPGEELAWGFAAVSLTGLGRTPCWRRRALMAGLFLGGLTVVYPLLAGACRPSQPVIGLLVSWIIFLGWRHIFAALDRFDADYPCAGRGQACGR